MPGSVISGNNNARGVVNATNRPSWLITGKLEFVSYGVVPKTDCAFPVNPLHRTIFVRALNAAYSPSSLIVGPIGAGSAGWSFQKDGKTTSIQIQGRLTLNVNEAVTVAAVAGLGIASTGTWGCRPELENGTLVQILGDWIMQPVDVHADVVVLTMNRPVIPLTVTCNSKKSKLPVSLFAQLNVPVIRPICPSWESVPV